MPGANLIQVGAVAMGLIRLIRAARARRAPKDKSGDSTDLTRRHEMERRMAAYLASRDDSHDPRQG